MSSQQPPSPGRDPHWLLQLSRNLRLAWCLLRDPTLPLRYKLIPVAAAIYVLFPGDLIPDFLPGLGQLDDLSVALLALKLFIDTCPPSFVAKHQARVSSVDASFRVVDDETSSGCPIERHLQAAGSRPPTDDR